VSDRARRVMVKRRAIMAGVPQDGHPHPWHHPVGTVMDRQITDIRGVQKRLGPVDLSATMMDTHSVDDAGEHVMKALYLGEERGEEPPMSVGDQPSDRRDTVRPSELVQWLRELDEELPDACYAQLLAAGAAIVPDLLAVLEDALVDEPGQTAGPRSMRSDFSGCLAMPGPCPCWCAAWNAMTNWIASHSRSPMPS
jgi:hypothetical protein